MDLSWYINFFLNVVCPWTGLFFLMLAPIVIPLIWKYRIPNAAKVIMKAKNKGVALLLTIHDGRLAELQCIAPRRGSGLMRTEKSQYKILPLFTTTPTEDRFSQKKDDKEKLEIAPEQLERLQREAEEESTYRYFLTTGNTLLGFGAPIFIGYSGTACIAHPLATAMVEAGEMKVQAANKWIYNENNEKGNTMDKMAEPLLAVDPRKYRAMINKSYDEQQLAVAISDAIQEALTTKFPRWLVYVLIGVGVIALLAFFLMK